MSLPPALSRRVFEIQRKRAVPQHRVAGPQMSLSSELMRRVFETQRELAGLNTVLPGLK
ncbi:MAG: hypothetical protein ABI847_16295 [Anaerolineales bacterium]